MLPEAEEGKLKVKYTQLAHDKVNIKYPHGGNRAAVRCGFGINFFL